MHSGHYNALRQAKTLGDILVAGVHSDAEITRNKGPPTMKEDERLRIVKACKWVDEVVFDVPYSPTIELLDRLNCDFCVHGDDMPTNADGKSAYDDVLKAGRLKIVKRTEGVSTTTLVGRLLLKTREHHLPSETTNEIPQSLFLPTTRRIYQFSKFSDQKHIANSNPEHPPSRIVYVDGSFDMFHVGHVELLEQAKKQGDFLLVGVHDDLTLNQHEGRNFPIMNLHERILNVLACKHVDEVILGAPWTITRDMITTMNIAVVATGYLDTKKREKEDPYEVPKQMGVFHEIKINSDLTTEKIEKRILENRQQYEQLYERKKKKEQVYINEKQYLQEL